MKIAVAGGTGLMGRKVVRVARAAGHATVVLARSAGVDLVAGVGLDTALAGASAVIDVSNVVTVRRARSVVFFEAMTRNLLEAEARVGVAHHVALTIVGCDRVPLGYYAGKRRQEELVLSASVPSTVLRSTQFHEFAAQMLTRRGPVCLVPMMLSQPVAADEVAAALVAVAAGPAVGLAPELAGPEQITVPDMVRRLVAARGTRRFVVPVRLPGRAGRGMARGDLLPAGDGPRGSVTFADWLRIPEQTPADNRSADASGDDPPSPP